MFKPLYCYITFVIILLCLPCQGLISMEAQSIKDFCCIPKRTKKGNKIASDPINIVIVGSEEAIHEVFTNAGWSVADKLTLSRKIRIALDCIFNLSYRRAPVSTLYYLNKPQDIAYQLQHGSPRRRHHVRFWKVWKQKPNEEVWAGAASFDSRIKFSSISKKFTHKISPDIDNERDMIVDIFQEYGFTSEMVNNFHIELLGTNGEGDYYYTDGKLALLQVLSHL